MMKKSSQQYQKAFTLIEVMAVIAIVTILSAILLVSSSGSRTAKEIENAGQEIEGAMRIAQNYALTGRTVTGSGIPATAAPCYFMMSWSGGTGSYVLTYIYKNTSSDTCSSAGPSSVIATYSLRNGVVFSSGGSFYFSLPHANIFDSAGAIATSKGVIAEKAGVRHTACIYAGGRIRHVSGSVCP